MNRLSVLVGSCLLAALTLAVFIFVNDKNPVQRLDDNPTLADQQIKELILPVIRLEGHFTIPDGSIGKWRGSGVVVYSRPNEVNSGYDNYVLTCNHCVEIPEIDPQSNPWQPKILSVKYGVDYIEIFDKNLKSNRKVPGVVVAHSNNNVFVEDENGDIRVSYDGGEKGDMGEPSGDDLALVRLLTSEPLQAAKLMSLADVAKLKLFFRARVVGCSLGMKPYHTFGEITRLEGDYMSVSAPFVPGNSGGACYLDSTHEFLGITNAGISSAPHMGLIRPLERIYDWMLQNGYDWIYNPDVKADSRFDKIRRDKADTELSAWRTSVKLQEQVESLQDKVTTLQLALHQTNEQVEELRRFKAAIENTVGRIVTKIVELIGAPKSSAKEPSRGDDRIIFN